MRPASSGMTCLPRSDESDELLLHIRDLTSDRGAYARHERSAAALPVVSKVDVLLIREPAICAEGAAAYDRVRARATPGASVLVIRVGDRYVVYDPAPVAGEASVLITFDRSFSPPLAQWRY